MNKEQSIMGTLLGAAFATAGTSAFVRKKLITARRRSGEVEGLPAQVAGGLLIVIGLIVFTVSVKSWWNNRQGKTTLLFWFAIVWVAIFFVMAITGMHAVWPE